MICKIDERPWVIIFEITVACSILHVLKCIYFAKFGSTYFIKKHSLPNPKTQRKWLKGWIHNTTGYCLLVCINITGVCG